MLNKLKQIVVCVILSVSAFARADFGDKPVNWSNQESSAFRDFAVRSLNKQHSLVNNYWLYFWLNQKIIELNLLSPKPIGQLTPVILNQKSINAFALPGNIIGIHSGLWLFAETESEFLSVLAHEMGHIALDHFSRINTDQKQQGWLIASGVVLSILLAQQSPDAANAALLSSFAVASQNNLAFSRTMELEADQLGQETLSATQYNPDAGRGFFQRLERATFSMDGYEFLRTHPLGTSRASRLNKTTPPASKLMTSLPGFDMMQDILIKNGNSKAKSIFHSWYLTNTERSWDLPVREITDPNVWLGWVNYRQTQHNNASYYENELKSIILKFSGFVPARVHLFNSYITHNDPELCSFFDSFSPMFDKNYITLDILERMSVVSNSCSHSTSIFWKAKLFWQSGKETSALNLLSQAIASETNTNQLARHKDLLHSLTRLYERFP